MSAMQHRVIARYYEVRRILEISAWTLPFAERVDVLLPSEILSAPAILHPSLLTKEQSKLAEDIPFGFVAHLMPPLPPSPTIAVRLCSSVVDPLVLDVRVAPIREFAQRVRFHGKLNTLSGEPVHFNGVDARIAGNGNAFSIGRGVRLVGVTIDIEGVGNTVRIGDEVELSGHVVIRANRTRLLLAGPSRFPHTTDIRLETDGETREISARTVR